MSKVLVTGGAGYIGSHTVLELLKNGYEVLVYDNLSTGHAQAVLPPAKFIQGDLNQPEHLQDILKKENISSILHFAASIVVPESVSLPLKYYYNNVKTTLDLIQLAVEQGVSHFIFSSSAAVYGLPERLPVNEESPLRPINPYGRTKLMGEWILQDTAQAEERLNYIILRYFNVAGADPQGKLGQSTPEATHLVKAACKTALRRQKKLQIFGTDYSTFDGTGIRDYIHVKDLAEAHVLALQYLEAGQDSDVFNCGYGHGYSVKEIVKALEKVCNKTVPTEEVDRRPGDPAQLVADPGKLQNAFDWQPQYDDIETIVRSAYEWEINRFF